MAPPAPDYSNLEHWAALPDREDAADLTPEGINDGQADAAVDVFFVHPTTFLSSTGWNAPMGDLASGNWVDNAVMPGQASVFNGAARVYAPRYRQAQIYAFFALEDGGNDAFEDNEGALSIVANTLMPGAADGRCENGMLYVSEIRTDAYDDLPNMGKGNHHLLDYALYWSNIRKNVAERVAAFN